ncbi:MAG: RagB/SusD family nutrient uptake outer membrane protein [Bacteroides sp.]|nr:RagB/SusD family nutrient uptake outer membrane protein [Bacteroides sp.]
MKEYINKLFIGSLMGVAMLATSCSDNYLNTAPTSSVGTSTAFATTENAAMAINGIAQIMCYQQFSFSQGYCGENRIKSIYGEYPGQDFVYNIMSPGWADIMNGDYYTQASSAYSAYPWYYYYTIIGNANSIIHNVDDAEGLETEKEFIKAQALSFRAYAYSQLIQLYAYRWDDTNNGATDGVVLRLDESTGSMPLSTVKECYDQIYQDCEDAITLYKSSGLDRNSSQVWLPNINVAYAVYARAALNRQDYQTALTYAKLARQDYPLMSNADYLSGFCRPTSEWIFGSYGDGTENMWYWTFSTQFSCNGYYANNTQYGAGAIDKILTDKIPNNDVRKQLFLTADKFSQFDLTDPEIMNQTYAYFTGDDIWYAAEDYILSMTPSGLEDAYQAGYFYLGAQLKFWVFDTPGVSYLCHIRSSEMILIEAEANYFLNQPTEAQAALVELNATSGRNPNYTCTKTGEDLFQEIIDYRSFELWGEGFNWFDYKRWNKDIARTGIPNGGNVHAANATTITANGHSNWTWVIPELETNYNEDI